VGLEPHAFPALSIIVRFSIKISHFNFFVFRWCSEEFQDFMLTDFRAFCSNDGNRLTSLVAEIEERVYGGDGGKIKNPSSAAADQQSSTAGDGQSPISRDLFSGATDSGTPCCDSVFADSGTY
jgi:hypothetical protein